MTVLSSAQRRLWFAAQFEPGSAAYNLPFVVTLRGPLDVGALVSAMRGLAETHVVLRTAVEEIDGAPSPIVLPPQELRVVESTSVLDALDAEARRPFDLRTDRPMRATLFRLSDDEHVLAWTFHHIAVDGSSFRLLLDELGARYQRQTPETAPAYAEFAAWEQRQDVSASLGFWAERLLDLSASRPPVDHFADAAGSAGGAVPFEFSTELAAGVRRLAARSRCTPFVVLLAALKVLLARLTGDTDVVVAVPVTVRTDPRFTRTIGCFTNTVAMRTSLAGDPTTTELLHRVRRSAAEAAEHGDAPFDEVVRTARATARVSTMLTFNVGTRPTPWTPDLAVEVAEHHNDTAQFDLDLTVSVEGTTVRGRFVHHAELFDERTVARWLDQYLDVLARMIAEPGGPALPLRLHELVARHDSDATALVWPGGSLTRGELDARANHVAHRLRAEAVATGEPVGVRSGRGPDFVVALLGVLKAGGCVLPLDEGFGRDRLQGLLGTAGVRVILDEVTGETDALPPAEAATATSLAYAVVTSGQTGVLKAAGVEHRHATAYLVTAAKRSHALLSTPTNSAGLITVLTALASGGVLHLAEPGQLRRHEVDVVMCAPGQLATLAEHDALPREEIVVTGPTEINQVEGVAVRVAYGPDEIAGPAGVGESGTLVPVVPCHVMDADGKPAEVGELWLSGPTVGRGYLGEPVLTARGFVEGPDGTRCFRTGDRARRRKDGTLELLGRAGGQAVIRGHRVEPGEVVAALLAVPGVSAAAALPVGDRLVAWVSGDVPPDLRAVLRRRLPAHMVPADVVRLERLPLAADGSPDREALLAARGHVAKRAPSDAREQLLCELFALVLRVDEFGPEDDFFDRGGHSLLAARLVGRVRTVLGVDLALRTLFDAPTPAELAAALDGRGARRRVRPAPRPELLPLSGGQRALWFLSQVEGARTSYNQCDAWRLTGPLDVPALESALRDVLVRHEILRTVYRDIDGVPHQHVLAGVGSVLHVSRADDLTAQLQRTSRYEFDLAHEPPVRADLFVVDDDRHVLLVTVHHIAGDDASSALVLRDLAEAYRARLGDAAAPWAPLEVQYADYVLWRENTDLTGQVAYWADQLRGAPERLRLPWDFAPPAVATFRGEMVRAEFPAGLRDGLAELAQATNVTLFMALHAAVAVLLSRSGAGDDVPVGTPVAGRFDESLDDVAGFFVNTVVLRTSLAGDPTVRELLARVRITDLAAYDHQDVPFERLVDELNPVRSSAHNPLFQVMVVLQDCGADGFTLPGLEVRRESFEQTSFSKFDLTFLFTDQGDGLEAALEYSTDLFTRETALELLAHLRGILEAFAADPNQEIGTIAGLAPRALPAPDQRTAPAAAPSTRTAALRDLFADVLELPEVGPEDDFFQLGGHSLLAVRLVIAIRRECAAELTVNDVFACPTPSALGARLDSEPAGPRLRRYARPDLLPLSPAQQRMWVLHTMGDYRAAYNVAFAVRLTGALDREALRAAWGDVVTRHEPLRTVYPSSEGVAHQQILAPYLPELPCVEPGVEVLAAEAGHRFDLATERPLRLLLVRHNESEHVLSVVVHHVAVDSWSLEPLWRDLTEAYTARITGHGPEWTELAVQYADYALWQQELGDEGIDFWCTELAGLPEQLELPTDRPHAGAGLRGGVVEAPVLPQARARLDELARSTGATPFMVAHAAVAALLTRLGAGTDLPLGTVVGGRAQESLDDLVGFFVNTVVLRTTTAGRPSFRELVERVAAADRRVFAHQDVPFERVVEALNPVRSTTRNPLFQVMISFEDGLTEPPALPGLDASYVLMDSGDAKFDLSFEFTGWTCRIGYRTDLFDDTTVRRVAAMLERLLDAVSDRPDLPVHEIELEDADDRSVLRGERCPPSGRTVADLFEHQARRTPDAIAVAGMTFGELNRCANRLAHHLIERGAGPERYVAVSLPRGTDLLVALIAVAKTGAAYVPLDPGLPAERIRLMLAEVAPLLVLDRPLGTDELPDTDPARDSHLDEPAYVIYTSGSTGRPKGVVVTHRGLVNVIEWMTHAHPLRVGDVMLGRAAIGFDASVLETWWPLLCGATLCLPPADVVADPERLAAHMRAECVTHAQFVPSLLGQVGPLLTGVRVYAGGEALPARLLPGLGEVVNMYGPTETSILVTTWTGRVEDVTGPIAPLGTASANTALYVLDENLRPVPQGVAGELYVAGDQLARGYLAAPARTAQRFVADPFGPAGGRMYRTGDKVRLRAGLLEFLGRTDDQVKIRGFRIEPGEVEAEIARDRAVGSVVVLARDDRLVAYVVPVSPLDGLLQRLAAVLPAHLVPSDVVVLDQIPVTTTGKLDRAALPAPARATGSAEPRTPREEVVRDLFAEVLELPEVGVHDDFFALGGHSLLGTKLVSRARAALGADLTIADLFRAPTPAGLASTVDSESAFATVLPFRSRGTEPPLWCVHPVVGLAWPYAGLVRHLPENVPLFGLQATGLEEAGPLPGSVEEVAVQLAAQVRSVQPHGPYRLLGWSFGGAVAHAVATLLDDVSLLVMVDSYFFGGTTTPDDADAVEQHLAHGALRNLDDHHLDRLRAVSANNARLLDRHTPDRPFGGDVLFFTAQGSPGPEMWRDHVRGEITPHPLPFGHYDLMRPAPLAEIAGVITTRLLGEQHAQ